MKLTIEEALQQGLAIQKDGKLEEAERLYRAILQSEPKHPDANHNLGLIAVSVNKAGAALPLFKTALEANPQKEQFWVSYIDALIKAKQFGSAKKVLEQGKKAGWTGEKADALEEQLTLITQAAESALPEQKKSPAFADKRKKLVGGKRKNRNKRGLKATSPSDAEIANLGQQYQNGQYGDAERLALSLTERFPKHELGWKMLGATRNQTGRVRESLFPLQKLIELSPEDAAAHNNLGVVLKELKRLDEAEASYRQAVALRSDYTAAHNNLGNTLQELGRLDEAEASCRQAISLQPDFAEAHYNLGVVLQALDRLGEAEASYRQVTALKPDFAEAHCNLGVVLKQLNRLDEAEASYTQAIVLRPDSKFFHNRWALFFKKGDFEAALKDSESGNTEESRQNSLETLYALGCHEEVYQRIEIESKKYNENITTAAFASFLSTIEKKDTANKFCNNPIDFIHCNNISSYLSDSTEFIEQLIEELYDVQTTWEPADKATRKGFQTPDKINLFENPSGKIAYLKSLILDEIDSYYLKFRNESCSYIQKWPSKKNIWGWHVILKQQGYQAAHIHPNSWLSGVIYLKVVPSRGKDEGAIEFSLNGKYYSNVDAPKYTYQPSEGDIVFFPSSLHHKTIPFTTDTDRMIVSFDLMAEKLDRLI